VNEDVSPVAHPPLVDLLGFGQDPDSLSDEAVLTRGHVRDCRACASLLAGFEAIEDGASELSTDLPATGQLRGPAPDEATVGEIWMLEWEHAAGLALVVGAEDDALQVMPLDGPGVAVDDEGLPLVTMGGPEPAAFVVWSDPITVPRGVFMQRLGAASGEIPAHVDTSALELSWSAALARVQVLLTMEHLTAASWIPEPRQAQPLAQLMRERGLRPSDLSGSAGLSPRVVTELHRGTRPPTADEARLLGSRLGVSPDELQGTVEIPPDLARAVERPPRRLQIRAQADLRQISEAAERMNVAHAVLGMAARTTPGAARDVNAWDELVGHYLHE